MNKTFGQYIQEHRIEKAWSMSELARRVSITPQYVKDIETDRIIPSEDKIEKLVSVLELEEKTAFILADKIPLRIYESAKQEYFNQE
jgi:transcriptional regulator with XRE-family HTH domain